MKKVLFTGVFFLFACAVSAQTGIMQTLEGAIKRAGVPGMQVVHTKDGKATVYAVGEKKYESADRVTENTLFQACSMSKSVLAYVALVLYDKGVIDLDTPLLNYWKNPRLSDEPRGKQVTARMALTNTTGFPSWTKPRGAKLTIDFKPGTKFQYSGEGFLFLQQVLEHLTGKSLEELAQEFVFEPFGMKESHFIFHEKMRKNYANGHEDLKPLALRGIKEPNGAYSLITTASDYSVFIQRALIKGEGLKPHTHEMMTDYSSSRGPRTAYGMGVQLQRNQKGKAIFHNGSNPGFRCFYFAYPATGESLVVMTNGSNGVKIKREVARLLLGKQDFFAF